MTKREQHTQAMISFLRERILFDPDYPLDEQTPLVSSGLVDSFSLVEVLAGLEQVTGQRIPGGRVSPLDLDTVQSMLDVADRIGAREGL